MPPAPPKPPPRLPTMVGWYDPLQLLQTARQTILADIFGGRADFRLHEAGRGGELALDYRERVDEHGALWIDYVSDMGDGFDSTYSVARAVAAPALTIAAGGPGGTPLTLPRGQLLILGGDQVYPTPDDAGYLRRLVDPYEMALPAAPGVPVPADAPHLLALPGNHDWYDGLQSFVKVFCRRTRVGGWVTPQARSYFALQLPHQTWLFGLDTQLNGDLDETQLGFFSSQKVQAGQRVIFCLPEPQWMMANPYDCSARLPNNLVRLLDHLALREVEVPLLMAGDLHHYRRHSRGRRGGGDGRRHPPPGDRRRGRRLPAPHPHPAARPALLLPRRTQPAAAALQADPVSGQRPEGALPGGPLRADILGRGGAAVPAGPRISVGQAQLAAHAGELRVPAAQPAVRPGHRRSCTWRWPGSCRRRGRRSGRRATP